MVLVCVLVQQQDCDVALERKCEMSVKVTT